MDYNEEKQAKEIECPFCGNAINTDMKYCPFCGKQVNITEKKKEKCPFCNGKINSDMEFCPKCGHKIENKKPQQKETSNGCLVLLCYLGIMILVVVFIISLIPEDKKDNIEESTIHYVSNKIVLDPDTICPNMDPFVYKHGLQLVKVTGKIDIDTKGVEDKTNSLGCVIKLVLSFKNISGSTIEHESFKVQYKIKDNETDEIMYSGAEYISLEGVKPDEVWAKSFEVLQCTFFYNNKIKVLLTIDDVEVEELTIKPKM